MQLYDAVVTYPLGEFKDFGYGPSASLAFEIEGFDEPQRIWAKENQRGLIRSLGRYDRGDQIQVAQVKKGKRTSWEIVDDGLPFDDAPDEPDAPDAAEDDAPPPRARKSAAKKPVPKPEPAESGAERLARLEKTYSGVLARSFTWLVHHYAEHVASGKLQEMPPPESIGAQASTVLIQLAHARALPE